MDDLSATRAQKSGELVVLDGTVATQRAAAIARAFRAAARKSNAPTLFVSGGGGFAARKGARTFFYGVIASFVLLVLIPIAGASIYYGLIASDQYATEVKFSLQSGNSSVLDSLSGIVGITGSQNSQDAQVIAEFIRSRAMAEQVEARFGFQKLFSRNDVDWLSRLDPTDPFEDVVKFWGRHVDTHVEVQSGIITVLVRAFTAEDSFKLAGLIVASSEELVNKMTERARQDSLRQSKLEFDRAQTAMVKASEAMRDLRNREGILDAGAVAKASEKVITALKIALANREQDYAARVKSVSPDAPQMRILTAQIENIKDQIQTISAQLASPDGRFPEPKSRFAALDRPQDGEQPRLLSASMKLLEQRQLELSIAQHRYAQAATSYEAARLDASSQHAYLNSFVAPILADSATYPKRWWDWAIIVVPDIVIWLVLLGLSFMVRDHMV